MALNIGSNPGLCDKMAQLYGALAYTEVGCAPVSGRVVKIGKTEHSVMEGIETINFNFHAYGNEPASPTPNETKGPVDGFQKNMGMPI